MSVYLYLNIADTLKHATLPAEFAAACTALKVQFDLWGEDAPGHDGEESHWSKDCRLLGSMAAVALSPDGERLLPALHTKAEKTWKNDRLNVAVGFFEAQAGVPRAYVDVGLSLDESPVYSARSLLTVGKCLRAALELRPGNPALKAALETVERLELEYRLCGWVQVPEAEQAKAGKQVTEAYRTALPNGVPVGDVRRALQAVGLEEQPE